MKAVVLSLTILWSPAQAAPEILTVGGTGAALATLHLLGRAAADGNDQLTVQVLPSLGSSGGIRALQDGIIDLAVTARPLTDAERATGLREFHLADTPLAFVSSLTGPLNIDVASVTEIYARVDAAWPDGTPARVILRPQGDAQYRILQEHFPGFMEAIDQAYRRPDIPIAPTDQDNVRLALRIAGSFTAATLAQIRTEDLDLTLVSIDGVAPLPEHIADGRYPMHVSFYLVAPSDAGAATRWFLDFVRTPRATAVLIENGQLPAGAPGQAP